MPNNNVFRDCFKCLRISLLAYLWSQLAISWYYVQPIDVALLRNYVYIEFLDIPYYYFVHNTSVYHLLGILAHHVFVVINYSYLMQTQFILPHMITYMFHHTYKNIPKIKVSLKNAIITWSTQFLIPTYYYIADFNVVLDSNTLIINFLIICFCYISSLCQMLYLYLRYKYQLSVLISYKSDDQDTFELRKLM